MGDYTKLIVNCAIKYKSAERIEEELEEFHLRSSAYHCGGELVHISHEFGRTELSIISQHKYSRGIDELIAWLRPQVIQGFGEDEIFAISCTEYQSNPTVYKLRGDQ